jgi:S-ribosylhomocysteine lyase
MGCRTGFYLIVRDLSNKDVITLVKETLEQAIDHEGELPGAAKKECGNYLDHDVEGAKVLMKDYLDVIKDWTIFDVRY